ncbi:hypothetical protein SAMN05192545_3919 [Maribacter dokdonensis]|uniref:XRE family transcriptional regulator n=1 Tax=Maribacter dokdonensis TaxID=320912 RepID=A0ABY0V0J1_9FLAO|nr:hypothetical protein [Maribacter dokdonensis]SDT47049.1 hypothetical protein SAMN05192545_3919 [Maribacter dokdonensis]
MTKAEFKRKTGTSQKDFARFFNMSYDAFTNSSAKERYINALMSFYEHLEERKEGN